VGSNPAPSAKTKDLALSVDLSLSGNILVDPGGVRVGLNRNSAAGDALWAAIAEGTTRPFTDLVLERIALGHRAMCAEDGRNAQVPAREGESR
jgi:hypothetical protein